MLSSLRPQEQIDSIAKADPRALLPGGPRRHPFALDVETMLSDRVAFDGLSAIHMGNNGMLGMRRRMLDNTRKLRKLVKADSIQP